jgi:nitroreductase
VIVVACLATMIPISAARRRASLYGSIFPSVQNLLLAARAAGLGAALITLPLWSTFLARRALGLPWTITPCAVVPLGWPRGRYGPTTRKPVGEVIHSTAGATSRSGRGERRLRGGPRVRPRRRLR